VPDRPDGVRIAGVARADPFFAFMADAVTRSGETFAYASTGRSAGAAR